MNAGGPLSTVLDDATLAWLLEPENPSVRYHTLTRLLHLPSDDPDVRQAQAAIMTTGLVPRILAGQNNDGSWDNPDRYYTAKYTGTVWTLIVLAEFAADPAHPQIQRACDFILEHARCPESGGFAYQMSQRTGTGLPSSVIPCLTGNMVASLIQLGQHGDTRIQAAIDWITTWQRADDGDAPALPDTYYKRFPQCFGRHSCHMGVAKAMKALAAIPPERRSAAVSAKLDEFAEYFLRHHLYKKSHDLDAVSRPGWLRLGFPLMYQTDILELAGIFASLGIRDNRLRDALGIIAGKRGPDGRWCLETTCNGKMQVRIEQKGKPSKWITLRALDALGTLARIV